MRRASGSSRTAFNGQDPNGTWTLKVVDDLGGDSGTINSWSLTITTCSCAAAACVITCPPNQVRTNDPDQCGAAVTYPPPTTTGDCGHGHLQSVSGSFFPVGTTTVACTSSAGPTCSFTVTVIETQPPTIMCPANITRSNDPNQCGAFVTYPPPTVSDNCSGGVGTPVCSPASGSFFPVGTTTVTCGVSDFTTCENIFAIDTANNLVNFRTTTPGVVSSKPITVLGTDESVVGIDFRPATGAITQVGSGFTASGSFTKAGNTIFAAFGFDFNPTVDRIRITSDTGSNLSVNPDTAAVTVQTPLNPGTPNIVGSAYTNNFVGATVTTLYAIDSGDDMPKIQNPPASGTLITVGALGVATTGNVGFDISQCGGTAYATLEPTGGNNGKAPTGAGGGSNLYAINLGTGQATLVGAISGNTITAMSVEVARTATCTFTVTVNLTQPPSITCPANVTAVTDQNVCPSPACRVVNYPAPVATDNCPGVTVVCNPPAGSRFPTGVTTVTCTATDASNNTATCSFTVTTFDVALQDDSDPSIILLWNSITGAYRFCCHGVKPTPASASQPSRVASTPCSTILLTGECWDE